MDTSQRTISWSRSDEGPGADRDDARADRNRGVTLDAWSGHPWTGGVQVDELAPFDAVEVQTRNTRYEITVVDGRNGEVLVTGGRFFPVPTRVRVNGCTLGGSCLKWRGVYPGFLMELQVGGEVIITTRVRSVARRPTAHDRRPHYSRGDLRGSPI
jgi:hypothetical protein